MKYLHILIILLSLNLSARDYTITPDVNQTGPIDFTRMIRPNEYRRYAELKQQRSLTTWKPSSAFNLHSARVEEPVSAYGLPKWQMDIAYLHDRATWEKYNYSEQDKSWIYGFAHWIDGKMEEYNIRWIRKTYGVEVLNRALVWQGNMEVGLKYNGKFKSESLQVTETLFNQQRTFYWIGHVLGASMHIIVMLLLCCTSIYKIARMFED